MTDSMAAMFDRLREAAAAHDEPVGSCAAVPVGPTPADPLPADPQTQAAETGHRPD